MRKACTPIKQKNRERHVVNDDSGKGVCFCFDFLCFQLVDVCSRVKKWKIWRIKQNRLFWQNNCCENSSPLLNIL